MARMRASLPRSLLTGWYPPGRVRVWLQAGGAVMALLALAGLGERYQALVGERDGAATLPLAQRAALEHCSESAALVHDVRWAAACMALAEHDPAHDGAADCELPTEQAGRLNALLQEADRRCLAEAMAGPAS
jgi:hypothetical protein